MSGRGCHRHRMKQDTITKAALFLTFFLTISTKAFGVMPFDLANVSASINLPSIQAYLAFSGSPSYDAATDTYHVPAVIGEEISVPDPTRTALGDASNKSIIVGNPIVLKLPGSDMVKLAAGSFANFSGTVSDTLLSAADIASDNPPSYNNLPYFLFTQATADSMYMGTPNFQPPIPFYATLINSSGVIVRFTFLTSASGYGFGYSSCQTVFGLPPNTLFSSTNFNPIWIFQTGGCFATTYLGTTLSFDSSKFTPGGLTSTSLASQLLPSLSGWRNNGLDNDFKQAAENGSPSIDGIGPTTEDIDNWKLQNQSNVEKIIPNSLGSEIGPSAKRPCGDPGAQGP